LWRWKRKPHQTVQKLPALDLTDGISPDVELTIETAKRAIKNMIACDSTENEAHQPPGHAWL